MIYAVFFEDNDDRADMRAKHMADHLAFLERNSPNIQAAGPLKLTEDGSAAGGLWVVIADDHNAVQALVEADPFWPTGLRKQVRILEWTQVFADGRRKP